MEEYYHLNCYKCGYDYWSNDGFPNFCPHCGQPFEYNINKCDNYIKYNDESVICTVHMKLSNCMGCKDKCIY